MNVRTPLVMILVLAAGCELREISLAQPDDVVIVEAILRSGQPLQTALIQRSFGLGAPPLANVTVTAGDGSVHRYIAAPDSLCLAAGDSVGGGIADCYAWTADDDASFVTPGGEYRLRVVTEDGRTLTGETRVPGDFDVVRPGPPLCELEPDQLFELVWTAADDTWVYIAEAQLLDLRSALRPRGIAVPSDPLRLVGLSITREDTTVVLPSEFGLFDRFDDDVSDVLVALQNGLPARVRAEIYVGAADRNYVNWVRGGNFNPSGTVRVPSVFGTGGTGVFGSVVTRKRTLVTEPADGRPPCG